MMSELKSGPALAQPPLPPPFRRLLLWFLLGRVLVVTLLLGGALFFHLRDGSDPRFFSRSLYLLLGIFYGQTVLAGAAIWWIRRRQWYVHAQIVWDLLFIAGLIFFTGGIDSPFSFLFFLVVIGASVVLVRREMLVVASAAAILYGSLLDLQYYGYLPRLAQWVARPQPVDSRQVFFSVFIHVSGILVTAWLCGLLIERLRRSEQALAVKTIDLVELEHFNRTILSSIGSGLMIVNPLGRIRSFNLAAEKISNLTLDQVYDRDVREIFPGFAVYDGSLLLVDRGEGFFDAPESGRRTFGYASSWVKAADGHTQGLLVNFRDMTEYKGLEERLKRADRLAAVGQLASGMAHEIRNPLASISGSVQLLMEATNVSEEDRRLMGIVIKEADRLSDLLTDFLLFAHPGTPKIARVDISAVLDGLAMMAATDSRFAAIEIRKAYPAGVWMLADSNLLHQALWNLLINGAEAMPEGGFLTLDADGGEQTIVVEDCGPGIPEQIRNKIFNPFFTTKDSGTGLGLATVHAIVEAHGGSVGVARGCGGGARFFLRLDGKAQAATVKKRPTGV